MAKPKPEHFSTIHLDIERWIGFTWTNIEELSATLKMDLLGDGGMLMRAGMQNPRALNLILQTGLQHWDPQLRYERVQEMVQDRLNKGGKIADLIEAVYKAMRVGGFLGEEAGALPTSTGPVGPGQAKDGDGTSGPVGPGQEGSRPLALVTTSTDAPLQP